MGFERRPARFEHDGAVLDEPALDDERQLEEGQRGRGLAARRAGGGLTEVDLGGVEDDGKDLAVAQDREIGDLDPDPAGPKDRRIGEGADILEDEGRREIGQLQAVIRERLVDPLADLAEQDVLADDQAAGQKEQDEGEHRRPPGLLGEGPGLFDDPGDRMEPHFLTFLQSARNRSTPMSVRGCRTSFSMTPKGTVAMSAPRRAASTTWRGWRTLATMTSVSSR